MIRRKYNLNTSLAVAVAAVLLVIILGILQKQYALLGPANVAAFGFVKSVRSVPLTVIMTVVTWFGSALGLMVFISVVFWLGYSTEIVTFMLMVIFGSSISEHLKEFFAMHRPVTSEIPVIAKEKGFGYPSGHSQSGMYYSWLLFAFINKYAVFCLIPAFLLAFSRIYLGAHYFSDTVGGMLLGFGILVGATGIYSHVRDLRSFQESIRRSPISRVVLAIVISAAYLLVAWGQADSYKYGGFLLGFFFVYPALGFRWRARNPFFGVIASLIGLAVLLAIQVGSAVRLPDTNYVDFLTYFVLGILLAVAPLFFVKIRLMKKLPEESLKEVPNSSEKEETKEPVDIT